MNKWTRKRKARGFTLVELLIVIVIIGILAGSMLLVFGSATDKAKATKVVSNLRNLKAAALMYYADYNDWPDGDLEVNSSLDAYMDRDIGSDDVASQYGIEIVSGDTGRIVYAIVEAEKVREKLVEMASDSGLVDESAETYEDKSKKKVGLRLSN